ncbi:chemotaxis protein CheX [Geothermobacter ehrlichii]|uniref:Chemotaxis protein CheX n=1 Tax=Geothermobacter ehrlichii TaxID=213224 RepID=A0A5D3WM27_9BACT|nr:chemotaxis protein CheX [Geothermobacter ehrlichii]TYP00226.1 chemotaxis protein CheX [Geothermobacter ehrlichii]
MNQACENIVAKASGYGPLLTEAVQEIFTDMIPMAVSEGEILRQRPQVFRRNFSGLLGFSGDIRGIVGIHCPEEVGQAVYQAMLGMPEAGEDGEVRDMVGELVNMLAGGLKIRIQEGGRTMALAVPQLFSGGEYQIYLPAGGTWMGQVYRTDRGPFIVELKIFD